MRIALTAVILIFLSTVNSLAEERFVTILKISGNRLTIAPEMSTRGGRGMRGGGAAGGQNAGPVRRGGMGRGPRGGGTQVQTLTVIVPADAKITSALREQRTSEFRAGAELAGGLRHEVFQNMQRPLSARIMTDEKSRITEVNVIMPQSDINQANTDASGSTVIAVKPKRPPMKRK